jgi:hypothetical protein
MKAARRVTASQLVERTSITGVWFALGGGEIRRGRAQAFWRQRADGWSVSIREDCGVWYDHRDGVGGGILDLIRHVRGGTRGQALRWLADAMGIELDGNTPLSREQRRRYARARHDAPELARVAKLWHAERRAELDELKREALERDDMPALMAAAQENHLLTILAPEGIVRAYLDATRKWPEHTAALIAQGEEWERISEALVTLLTGRWLRDALERCARISDALVAALSARLSEATGERAEVVAV